MPLLRDQLGNLIPQGKVTRTLVADFLDGTMPSWIEAATGTATISTPASSYGYCQVATGSTINDVARLRTTFDIDTSHFRAVAWTVEAFVMDDDDNCDFGMGITNTAINSGCHLYHTAASGWPRLEGLGSGSSNTILPFKIRSDGEATRRKNLTLLWLPQEDESYVLANDQVLGWHHNASLTPGTCRPFVSITTKEAASNWMRVSQVRLDLVHN